MKAQFIGLLALYTFLLPYSAGAVEFSSAYCLTGKVTSETINFVEVNVGDTVTGSYAFSFNESAESFQGSSVYDGINFDISINGSTYTESEQNISIGNDVVFDVFSPVDRLEISTGTNNPPFFMLGPDGPELSGLPISQVDIVLIDTDASAFSDNSLPENIQLDEFEIVDEDSFGTTGGRLIYGSGLDGYEDIRFRIENLKEITNVLIEDQVFVDIPAIDVNGSLYSARLLMIDGTNPLEFSVEELISVSREANDHDAYFDPQTGLVNIPILRLPDGGLYQAQMKILRNNPIVLELTDLNVGQCVTD